MDLYTEKSFPNNDVVQTEGKLARGRERRVPCGTAVFRAFDAGRCDVGDPRVVAREDWGAARGEGRGASLVLLEERCQLCSNEGGRGIEGKARDKCG